MQTQTQGVYFARGSDLNIARAKITTEASLLCGWVSAARENNLPPAGENHLSPHHAEAAQGTQHGGTWAANMGKLGLAC